MVYQKQLYIKTRLTFAIYIVKRYILKLVHYNLHIFSQLDQIQSTA